MTDLKNKTAIVTGSVRGIGKGIAERYAQLGANIVLNYSKDKEAADKTVEELKQYNVKVIAVQANVSKPDDIKHLFDTALAEFGKIDIVVANAGLELTGLSVVDFTEEQYDRMFDTNTKGAFFTLQQAAKTVADNGRIIYISSSTVAYPNAGYALHAGSKVAPQTLVKILAKELGSKGICVNTIQPMATEGAGVHTHDYQNTQLKELSKQAVPMGRMGNTTDIANVAEFFAGDLCSYVSGQTLLVNGGASM